MTAKLARLISQNIASGGSSSAYRGVISDSSSLTDEATLDNVAASAIAVLFKLQLDVPDSYTPLSKFGTK